MNAFARSETGTLSWARRTDGVLGRGDAERLLRNLMFVRTQEQLDAERRRLGLLRPVHVALDSLRPPDTKMVADALRHARETHLQPLLFHSWRTYFFGALIGQHDDVRYDPEIFFCAAILHDLGLTEQASVPATRSCFAVTGALQAHAFLCGCGHPATAADEIAAAITVHLNLHAPVEDYGATAFLTTRGAVCDAFGPGLARVNDESVRELLRAYPRDGLEKIFTPEPSKHLPGTRGHALVSAVAARATARLSHPLDDPRYR